MNSFGLVNSDQNNTSIEKLEDNKIIKNSRLIFYIDCFTNIQYLCISFDMTAEVITVIYRDKHMSFAKFYKIIARLWYIWGLIKHFCSYIKYCPQCLILQTKKSLFFVAYLLIVGFILYYNVKFYSYFANI